MPSSREAAGATAVAWEPADLAGAGHAGAVRTTAEPAQAAPCFELSTSAGVPDAVLGRAREAAEQAGYVAGWNHGQRAVLREAQYQAQAEQARARSMTETALRDLAASQDVLVAAAQRVRAQQVTLAADVEALIVDAALRIAEALVGVSLADDAQRGRAAVTRALALAPEGDAVVALHPADLALLPPELPRDRAVRFVPDPTLAPGDAVARCGGSTLDARIGAGLDRVRTLVAESTAR
ncbi:FliH/SctL family protein [uncultured Jatrophihabitans sp.]|uniref:FliH/SctL family protein n=1 Tax=uncultured Jatrophihabitans sp. TaxID=1610747 RepID=UPI0035C97099